MTTETKKFAELTILIKIIRSVAINGKHRGRNVRNIKARKAVYLPEKVTTVYLITQLRVRNHSNINQHRVNISSHRTTNAFSNLSQRPPPKFISSIVTGTATEAPTATPYTKSTVEDRTATMSVSTTALTLLFFQLASASNGPASNHGGTLYHEEGFHIVARKMDLKDVVPSLTTIKRQNEILMRENAVDKGVMSLRDSIIKEISSRVTLANTTITELMDQSYRGKRGIDALGIIWNKISSAPGPKQYRQQNKAINQIQQDLKQEVTLTLEAQHQLDNVHKIEEVETKLIEKAVTAINPNTNLIHTKTEIAQITDLLTYRSNALHCLDHVDNVIGKATSIIQEGNQNLLSLSMINKEELSSVVLDLTIKNKGGLQPVFNKQELHHYYQMKLTTVFIHLNEIHSYTRIPLTDPSDAYNIDEILSDNTILLRSKHEHYFRVITMNELNRCIQHGNTFVSDLRPIQLPSSSLICNNISCKDHLTKTIVDEFQPNNFLYKLPTDKETPASYRCKNMQKPTSFNLAPRGTLVIPPHCSISSPLMTIKAISQESSQLDSLEMRFTITPLPQWHTATEIQDILQANLTEVKSLSMENEKLGKVTRRAAQALQSKVNKLEDLSVNAEKGGWAIAGIICLIILVLIAKKFLC